MKLNHQKLCALEGTAARLVRSLDGIARESVASDLLDIERIIVELRVVAALLKEGRNLEAGDRLAAIFEITGE